MLADQDIPIGIILKVKLTFFVSSEFTGPIAGKLGVGAGIVVRS